MPNQGRDVFTYEPQESVGDSLQVTMTEGHINISIDEPWAGCTETGFGQYSSLHLPKHEAISMAKKILEFYRA